MNDVSHRISVFTYAGDPDRRAYRVSAPLPNPTALEQCKLPGVERLHVAERLVLVQKHSATSWADVDARVVRALREQLGWDLETTTTIHCNGDTTRRRGSLASATPASC